MPNTIEIELGDPDDMAFAVDSALEVINHYDEMHRMQIAFCILDVLMVPLSPEQVRAELDEYAAMEKYIAECRQMAEEHRINKKINEVRALEDEKIQEAAMRLAFRKVFGDMNKEKQL